MMTRRSPIVTIGLFAAMLGAISPVRADDAKQGDPQRGAVIAAKGTPAGAAPCVQCHASDGTPDASGTFPHIGGQSSYYLSEQLHAFSSGARSNALMSAIAKQLSADDIADVAAYYAGLEAPSASPRAGAPDLVRRGQQLATVGDAQRRIQACNNCHGFAGSGERPAVPYIGGQYAGYIACQLNMWQQGSRRTSADEMATIAKLLDASDISAVAAYYEQARPPAKEAAK